MHSWLFTWLFRLSLVVAYGLSVILFIERDTFSAVMLFCGASVAAIEGVEWLTCSRS